MRVYENKMSNGEFIDLKQIEMKQDVHIITGMIKYYFRSLPEPLCTFDCYDMFLVVVTLIESREEKLSCLKRVISFLPASNKKLLSHLMLTLKEIADNAQYNHMQAFNLAICFAPSILYHKDVPKEMMIMEMKNAQSVVDLMIINAVELFVKVREKSEIYREVKKSIGGETPREILKTIVRYSVRRSVMTKEKQSDLETKVMDRRVGMAEQKEFCKSIRFD
jgi:hypothetical protein